MSNQQMIQLSMKKMPITDHRYGVQQAALDEIAAKLGVVSFRPDYHRAIGDKNTVLFYLKEDAAHNRKVDQQPTHYSRGEAEDLMKRYRGIEISPEYIYRDCFWCFENSDVNGFGDFSFANRGKIDLRGPNWRELLERHIRIALTRKLRTTEEYMDQSVCTLGADFVALEAGEELES